MKTLTTFFFLLLTCLASAQAPTNWKSTGIGGGGALFSPSINPTNHNEIYMGCDMSELFHTTDAGATWKQINFAQVQGGHDSQVQFTDNANILYTVDYTSQGANDYIRPMKSTDGGHTWQVMAGSPYPLTPNGNILRLLADPHNSQHVMIADYGTIYFSTNGGTSFTLIHTCISNGAGNHIAGAYWDGNNIFIGTNDGVIYSTNGGTSFSTMAVTGITAGESILSFAGGKSAGTTRFYCLTSTSVYSGIQYGSNYYNELASVYVMNNASGTWVPKVTGITIGTDFPVFVGMAENNIDTAYLSGGSSSGSPIVMKTVNGGGNWAHVFHTVNNVNIYTGWAGHNGDHAWSFPEAPFGFTVALNDVNTLMVTDYSCAHITKDGGTNWHQQYVSPTDENPENAATPKGKKYHGIGLENTTNWNVMWTDSTHIFSSFSDIGGVMSDDKGASWKFIPIAYNSIYHMVQTGNGNIYAATSSIHDMYETTRLTNSVIDAGNGKVYFSSDHGATFNILHDFTKPVIWLAWDASRPNRMYAAVVNSTIGGMYVTNNLNLGATSTWTRLTTPTRTLGHPLNIRILKDGSLVASYSATKSNTGSTFSQSAGVFYSTDSGTTWSDRSDAKMQHYMKDVVIDPNDTTQNTWYACVAHAWGNAPSTANGLLRTTDRGQHWTQISNSYRVNSCAVNPHNANEMYFTTDVDGLWYTSNLSAVAPVFTLVDSFPFRSPVRVTYNPYSNSELWVSTFGNGMRYSAAPDTTTPPNPTVNITYTQPNCTNPLGSIHVTSNASNWDVFKLKNAAGQTIDSIANAGGSFSIDSLAAGNYTVILILGSFHDTLSAQIIASTPVVAAFTTDSVFIHPGSAIIFTNTSTGYTQSHWNLGDGTTSNSTSPNPEVYNTPGTYTITLISSNSNCADTVSHTITVTANPPPTFTVSTVQPTCINPYASITITSNASSWDLFKLINANGHTLDSIANVTGTFTVDSILGGNYTAVLVYGIYQDTFAVNINSVTPVNASFNIDSTIIHVGGQINVTNLSTGATQYLWAFDNGKVDTIFAPASQTYNAEGTYIITLAAYNANCGDTVSRTITVLRDSLQGISSIGNFEPTITLYPNPATDLIHIELTSNSPNSSSYLTVYDLLGKAVVAKRTVAANDVVDVSHLTPGIYLVQVKSGDNIMNKRVSVAR